MSQEHYLYVSTGSVFHEGRRLGDTKELGVNRSGLHLLADAAKPSAAKPELRYSRIWDALPVPAVPVAPSHADLLPLIVDGARIAGWLPGLYVVVAGRGMGKTVLIRAMARAGARIVRTGEPELGYTPMCDESISAALSSAVSTDDKFVGIDSIRALTLRGERLGRGGLPKEIAEEVTSLNYAAQRSGVTVVATLNVMSEDLEAVDTFVSGVNSSCAGTILIHGFSAIGRGDDTTARMQGVLSTRPSRIERGFTLFIADYITNPLFTKES